MPPRCANQTAPHPPRDLTLVAGELLFRAMRSFTNRAKPEPFELGDREWHLSPKLDLEYLADALAGIHDIGQKTGGRLTATDVVELRTAFAAVFAAALVPEDVEAFVAGIHNKDFDLLSELKPALEWVVENLGKRLGRSVSGSADGGPSSDTTSTDTVQPEA